MAAAIGQREGFPFAGALLHLDTDRGGDAPLDSVRARRYHHPALAGRTVVRLAGETVAVAEDRLLAFIGFNQAEIGEPLARTPRRGLGYVEWVLINDPDRGRAALAVAPEVERAARLAPSRPRAAIRLFEGLANRLPTAHLPALWEHAGRAFLAGDARRWAAAMFERAREAERVHGLRVDKAARDEAHREFGLAGALRTGSVARHVADLRRRREAPEVAYRSFLELVSACATGGMPPWSALPDQVRRLAGAAGRQPDAEEEQLLAELLALPATRQASAGFWRRCRPTLVRMSNASAAVRGTLLELFPVPRNTRDGFDGWWLDLLDEAGALDALVLPADRVPPESAPSRGAAGWLSRFLERPRRPWWPRRPPPAQLFALVARMARRLRADAEPLALTTGRWGHSPDANVLDVLVEHGVPIADLQPGARIDLDDWLKSGTSGGVRRSLEHLANDRRFWQPLADAVASFWGYTQRPADDLLVSPALEPLVRRWLEDRAGAVGQGGLIQASRELGDLERSTGPRTLTRFPKAHAALSRSRLAPSLARTLRGGLVDELGWPALEEAVAELEGPGVALRSSGSWPVLVVHSPVRAIAVGPGGRVAEHELRLKNPRPHSEPQVVYAGGQFLVSWTDRQSGRQVAYWSGEPSEVFPLAQPRYYRGGPPHGFSFLLPDGGRITGGRALYPGDRDLSEPAAHVLWDGRTFWAVEWERDRFVMRERDPRTGELGRRSFPSFLEDRAEPGETLLVELCSLAPLPCGLEGTPLGHRGGTVGFRVAALQRNSQPVVRVEGIDGRRLEAPPRSPANPMALVELPGATKPRLLGDFTEVELWDADVSGPVAAIQVGHARSIWWSRPRLPTAGTALGLPPAFWHCLSWRDQPGSHALRQVDDEVAAELLQAALEDLEGVETRPLERMPRTATAIERLLATVSHPRLLLGLLGTVATGARLERVREKLSGDPPAPRRPGQLRHTAPHTPAQSEGPPLDEEALVSALVDLGGLGSEDRTGWGQPLGDQLRRLGRFFAGEADVVTATAVLRAPALVWPALLGRIGAIVFRAIGPLVSQREPDALLKLLELWACLPFATDPGSFRVGVAAGGAGTAGRSERGAWVVLADTARVAVAEPRAAGIFIERRVGDGDATALPAGVEVVETRRVEAGWGTPAQLGAFVALARERRRPPWEPAVAEALADRTGLSHAEAILLWAGLPNLDPWHGEFLGAELRGVLGVKAGEAAAARARLQDTSPAQRLQLLDAAMPDDPADLWRPLGDGPDDQSSPVARLAGAWNGLFGRRTRPPEDALVEAGALGVPTPASELLAPLLDPAAEQALVRDLDWVLVDDRYRGIVLAARDADVAPMDQLVVGLAAIIPWAFAKRPVGDPLRARLPALLAMALDRLRHPGLLLTGGWHEAWRSPGTAAKLFGPAPYEAKPGTAIHGSADDGLTVAVPIGGWSLWLFFRPALLGDDARSALLRTQPGAARPGGTVAAVGLLRSAGYGAMAERVRATPVPDGGFEANPLLSAPELVRAAARALAVGDEAAALYLQLLTLPDPTDQNVRRWNRWTLARHRRAAAELLGAGLVVEAKRERSRRGLFLPGEWVKAAAPNLPLEAWKLPLYGLERDRATGQPRGPLVRFLHPAPLHELFAAAWARLEAGDRPEGEAR